ncbi:MAG: hypothetical protein PHS53_01710 [Candidatus Pacebacteria bacterium]|nr:hypothetical protein [Candidatus Paceibacterota bacterium]MDD5356846.1 hypothetical protein [Candidatus Paceibacterota bacterium]
MDESPLSDNKNEAWVGRDKVIALMTDILAGSRAMVQHLDTQTNILIGVSSALFVFSASIIFSNKNFIFFLILSFFSGISAIIGLYAIHPPKKSRKKGQKESIIYNKEIASFSSGEKYEKVLKERMLDLDKAFSEYALETYNVARYYYRPKRALFKAARNVLLTGIILCTLTFIIQYLFWR